MSVDIRVGESRQLSATGAVRELTDELISRAIGEELRSFREARDWSRTALVVRLPSGIGDRTLLSYEHGTRHLTVIRLIEICRVLGVDAPTLLSRALQRARIHVEDLPLRVDLRAVLADKTNAFRPMVQWARNTLNDNPEGVAELQPDVVRNLALFVGCTHQALANHLARFIPDDAT